MTTTMKMNTKITLVTVLMAGTVVSGAIEGPGLAMKPNQDYGSLYPMLGKNDLSSLDYRYNVEVDEDCNYKLEIEYKRNEELPIGNGDTCLPSVIAEYDGNSMLEGRWFYEELPPYIEEAIDVNHVSLDYNPCGHPGPGYLIAHFDAHLYRVSPEYRVFDMNCEVIAGTPACWPDQYIESGRKFFELPLASDGRTLKNMPEGFEFHAADVIIHMGAHIFETPPATTADWIDPTYIIGTYDSRVIFIEPMLPTHYMAGDESHFYERDLTSVEQDDPTLPTYYSIDYNGDTSFITMIFEGKSNTCKAEFDKAKEEYEAYVANLSTSGGNSVAAAVISSTLLLVTSSALLL